jgi:hypothetical protein
MDTARSRIRNTQVLHLSEGSAHSGGNAEGGQDVTGMGVEYWETTADRTACEEAKGGLATRWNGRQYEGQWCKARMKVDIKPCIPLRSL